MPELIILTSVGLVIMIIGLLIYKKQKVTLIHSYHYQNVSKENLPKYTEKMGKLTTIFGVNLIFAGILSVVFNSGVGFGVMFIVGIAIFVLIYRVQKKYNGGMF